MEPAESLEEIHFPGRRSGDFYHFGARYLLCHQGERDYGSAVPADAGVQIRRDQYEVQFKEQERYNEGYIRQQRSGQQLRVIDLEGYADEGHGLHAFVQRGTAERREAGADQCSGHDD